MVMIFANPKIAWAKQFGMELPRHRSELFSCRVAAADQARLMGEEDGMKKEGRTSGVEQLKLI